MDIGVTPAVAKTAGVAVLKTLGGMAPGAIREARRKRAVRRQVESLTEQAQAGDLVDRLRPEDVTRIVAYTRLPDFEQLAIQLAGLTLERKRPQKYVKDLRTGLARSLLPHSVVPAPIAPDVATALFDELWAEVVVAIGEVGQSQHPADMPGITVGVSLRAAAAARNSDLLKRLRSLDEIHSFTRTIRAQIGRIEGQVRPPHMTSGHRVPLARLYVEPHLLIQESKAALQSTAQVTPKGLLARHLRTVVLGDPGAGKSTLSTTGLAGARGPRARDGLGRRQGTPRDLGIG